MIIEISILILILLIFSFFIFASYNIQIFKTLERSILYEMYLNAALIIIIGYNLILFFKYNINISYYNGWLYEDLKNQLVIFILSLILIIYLWTTHYFNLYNNKYKIELIVVVLILFWCYIVILKIQEFFTFLILLEIITACFIFLIAMDRNSILSIQSAIKYFIASAIGTSIIAFNFVKLITIAGSSNFYEISKYINLIENININIIFILIGFMIKLFLVPFHFWMVDIYKNISYSSLFIISTNSIILYYYILLNLVYTLFYNYLDLIQNFIIIITVLSIVIGSIGTLKQNTIKGIIAYSSLVNYSYFNLVLIGFDDISFIYYIFNYMILYILNLLSLFIFLTSYGLFINNKYYLTIDNIYYLSGLLKKNPLLSYILIFNLFILMGFPPSIIFFSKLLLLFSLNKLLFYFFFIFILIINMINLFYYLKIVKLIFFSNITINVELFSYSNEYMKETYCSSNSINLISNSLIIFINLLMIIVFFNWQYISLLFFY